MTGILVCFHFLFNDDCLSGPVSEFPFRPGKDFPEEDRLSMEIQNGVMVPMDSV